MILLYVIILLISVYKMEYHTSLATDNVLGREQTTMIKGLFVMLVFASHSGGYVEEIVFPIENRVTYLITNSYFYIRHWLGQMIVVPFLFYSGYGIRLSITRRGNEYINTMPRNRILKTYVHTTLIIFLFYMFQLLRGEEYTGRQILLSFLLWDNFGNSNWYMFAILILYLETYICFLVFSDWRKSLAMCFFLTLIFFVVMWRTKESWWYNTLLVYWFGLIYPDVSSKVESITSCSFKSWILSCFGLFCCIAILTFCSTGSLFVDGFLENLRAIILMLWINTFLSHYTICNGALRWLGNHVFEIYMLQRLPMILFTQIRLADFSVVLWYIACAITTLILTILYEKILRACDCILFATK